MKLIKCKYCGKKGIGCKEIKLSGGSIFSKQENKKSMLDQIKKGKKIGRNEPCYCGSGKKFKHCCGAL